jgi:hypothetical protein
MPVPRSSWPRIVVSRHARPSGPGTLSAFSCFAIARGLVPAANSAKMRCTTAASPELIRRSPAPSGPAGSTS